MGPLKPRRTLDVSGLPTVVFGWRNDTWIGIVLFMLIEGSMVAMLFASYFYYRTRTGDWPPGVMPPALHWGVINGVVFLVSIVPAALVQLRSRAGDIAGCRLWLIVLSLFGAANVVLRIFEFTTLNCHWSANAYASMVWTLLGLHSGHLLTDFIETVVLAVVAFTDRVDGVRLGNFDENSIYWYFVVSVAVLADFVIYGASRLY